MTPTVSTLTVRNSQETTNAQCLTCAAVQEGSSLQYSKIEAMPSFVVNGLGKGPDKTISLGLADVKIVPYQSMTTLLATYSMFQETRTREQGSLVFVDFGEDSYVKCIFSTDDV